MSANPKVSVTELVTTAGKPVQMECPVDMEGSGRNVHFLGILVNKSSSVYWA